MRPSLVCLCLGISLAGCGDEAANHDMAVADMRMRADLPAPGPGRTCEQAIDLTNATLPYASSTAGGISQTTAVCDTGGDLNPEIYFTYDAGNQPVDLIVDVVVDAQAPWDALVTSRRSCDDETTETFCADNGGSQRLEVLGATGVTTLVVDGTDFYRGATEGAFTINVQKRPIVHLDEDCDIMGVANRCEESVCRGGKCVGTSAQLACTDAVDISAALEASGTTTITGFTLPFETGYYVGSCSFSTNPAFPERIYKITVTAPGTLDANSNDPVGTDFDTVLVLTEAACDGDEVACDDDIDFGNGEFRSHLTATLTPGTYYLFVDAASTAIYGNFDREARHYNIVVTYTRTNADM